MVAIEPIGIERALNHFGHVIGRLTPGFNGLRILLLVGNQTFTVLIVQFSNLLVGFGQDGLFLFRHLDIANGDGDTGFRGIRETETFDFVGEFDGFDAPILFKAIADDLFQVLLLHLIVFEAQALRQRLVEDDTPDGRLNGFAVGLQRCLIRGWAIVDIHLADAYFNLRLQFNHAMLIGQQRFRCRW